MKNTTPFTSAESLKENTEKSLKWFQESAASLSKTYASQLEFAGNLYKNTLEATLGLGKHNQHFSTETAEKLQALVQEGMKTMEHYTSQALDQIGNFSKEKAPSMLTHEQLSAYVHTFNEQAEALKAFNQTYLNALNKQFNSARASVNPAFITLQKDLETSYERSKESVKEFSDFYNRQMNDSTSASKEALTDLNGRMSKIVNDNAKLWADLFASSEAKSETVKPETVKSETKASEHIAHSIPVKATTSELKTPAQEAPKKQTGKN